LFLREAISSQKGHRPLLCHATLQRMMNKFHQKTPNYWSNQQYSEMFEFDGKNE
jgi:hypothetical protein